MVHKGRTFCIVGKHTPNSFAEEIKSVSTWTLCTGFQVGAYLWVNDSFTEDSAQEYAVIKMEKDERGKDGVGEVIGRQVESVTVSWCTIQRLEEIVREIEAGGEVDMHEQKIKCEGGKHHCELCA